MRLFEIAPDFTKSQAGVLMTILQHLDSKIGDGVKVPFASISKLMNNLGYTLTYKEFQDLHQNVSSIAGLVTDYDEQSITIGAKPEPEQSQQQDSELAVDKMAKSATRSAMNK